jgi:hypothetical protein
MSNVTSLEITNLFNCLSSHFIDNARFNAAALTNMAKYLTPTNYITFNDNKPFTIVNLSALILKIFTTNNPHKLKQFIFMVLYNYFYGFDIN